MLWDGSDLAPFVGNGTKIKIHFEIKPPLTKRIQLQVVTNFKENCPENDYNQDQISKNP